MNCAGTRYTCGEVSDTKLLTAAFAERLQGI